MNTAQRRSIDVESRPERARTDRGRASIGGSSWENRTMGVPRTEAPIANANENARPGVRSRLDEILARHRRRRSRALTVLLLWAVLGGAMLAI
jgi:hypothetical protein